MKVKNRIIVDCNYVGHACRFAVDSKMKTSKGVKTNVIYGFLQTILNNSQIFGTNDFIFVWDSKISKRKEIFPEYKKHRHKDMTPEEKQELEDAYKQFGIIKDEIIGRMGFKNNFMVDGYEGDDLIASIVKNDMENSKFLLYASDHDLYQLLSENVSMICKKEIYTMKKFMQEFGISPFQWWIVKCIAGCKSDEVPGITGVGEITACKYLKKELGEKTKAYMKIVDGKVDVMKKNKPLVRLPFVGTPVLEIRKNELDIKAIRDICKQFEFRSFLENFEEWREIVK